MVKIIGDWYYLADNNCYDLRKIYEKEVTNPKTGKKRVDTVTEYYGYYSTLAAMLTKLVTILGKEKIASGEITTLSEHVEELRRIKTELENDILPF